MSGPLAGIRLVEFAGLAAAPFAGMILSDLGADIVVIDRPGTPLPSRWSAIDRNRRRVRLDLKSEAGREAATDLCGHADGLFEGFRPGVMERLGLGPDELLARHAHLVFGRLTGWGQTGPYAASAGHDANYIAITGALDAIGPREKPAVPLNLIGDMGGGAMFLALGMVAALLHVRSGGTGQVVDAAMCDGAASLMAMLYGYRAQGRWNERRGGNRLDGGAPYYDTYQCADGGWMAVAAIEPAFYAHLLEGLGLTDDPLCGRRDEPSTWPAVRARLARRFLEQPRAYWAAVFAASDACCNPVLDMAEAPADPHLVARETFVDVAGRPLPAPAPRFSQTPGSIRSLADEEGTVAALALAWQLPDPLRTHLESANRSASR